MSKAVSIVCTMLILATMVYSVTPVSAQLLPEVIITCDDEGEIDSSPSSPRTVVINCDLENPSMHSEKITVQIQSGSLSSAGPESITIAGGGSTNFQVVFRSDEAEEPAEFAGSSSYTTIVLVDAGRMYCLNATTNAHRAAEKRSRRHHMSTRQLDSCRRASLVRAASLRRLLIFRLRRSGDRTHLRSLHLPEPVSTFILFALRPDFLHQRASFSRDLRHVARDILHR